MKTIQVNAYEYNQLNDEAKLKVKYWLDEDPMECEEEDKQGNITYKYCYFSEMSEEELHDHCEANEYLFDKWGNCVHHLDINRNKMEVA